MNQPTTAPIRIVYQESGDHLMEANKAAPKVTFKLGTKNVIIWAAILIGITSLQILKAATSEKGITIRTFQIPALILLAVGLFVYFLYKASRGNYSNRDWYKKAYRDQTGRDETRVTCEFGDVALFMSTEDGVATHHPWATIPRVVETPTGFLVYIAQQSFHWFPKRSFSSDADYRSALSLVASKVPKFERAPIHA